MSGFIIFDYQPRYMEAVKRLAEWVRDGKLRYLEEISDGIEHCPPAIAELYRGENLGKKLIRLQHSKIECVSRPAAASRRVSEPNKSVRGQSKWIRALVATVGQLLKR